MGRAHRRWAHLWVACALVCFTGCGIREGFDQPVKTEKKVQLYLFSAQWCDTCKEEMIELNEIFHHGLSDKADQILVTVYTVTNAAKGPPTPGAVEAFKNEMVDLHGVDFPTVIDPWVYQNYRRFFEWTGGHIPAAVVLDESGAQVLKKYNPGSIFTAADIADFLSGVLQ